MNLFYGMKRNMLFPLLFITVFSSAYFLYAQEISGIGKKAPPLPPPTGDVVFVSTVEELQSAVSGLVSGRTIVIKPGEYCPPRQ
ncbi:MAG: hypothetical protein U9P14_00440 [Gemmatimonadota bacterium]|nr:hypothetical protein [Gemmatimonadota bacterium]